MGSRIAHIDRLWLEPVGQGGGLGLAVLRECAEAACVGCRRPSGADRTTRDDGWGVRAGRTRLYAYWQRGGFVPLPGDSWHRYYDPAMAIDAEDAVNEGFPPPQWPPHRVRGTVLDLAVIREPGDFEEESMAKLDVSATVHHIFGRPDLLVSVEDPSGAPLTGLPQDAFTVTLLAALDHVGGGS